MEVPVTEGEWDSILHDKRYVQKFGRQPKMTPKGRAALITGVAAALIAVPILVKTLRQQPAETAQPTAPATETAAPQTTTTPSATTSTVTSPSAAPTYEKAAVPATATSKPTVTTTKQAATYEGTTMASVIEKRLPAATTATTTNENTPEPAVKNVTPEKSSPVATTEKTSVPTKTVKQNIDKTQSSIIIPTDVETSSKSIEPEHEEEEADQFFIPTAFTPNGDGLNDLFYVKANFEPRNFEMTIISRNGDRVFQTRDMNIGWDGKLRDKTLPQGMYVYVIRYKDSHGNEKQQQGQILLIP